MRRKNGYVHRCQKYILPPSIKESPCIDDIEQYAKSYLVHVFNFNLNGGFGLNLKL